MTEIPALKYDSSLDKAAWELCPFEAIEGLLRVLKYGERKYSICGDCQAKIYPNPRLKDGDPPRNDCPQCGSTNVISGSDNWRKGFTWRRMVAAAFRHLTQFAKGIDFDEESGELHLSHALCCVAFLSEHFTQGYGTDNRFIYKK